MKYIFQSQKIKFLRVQVKHDHCTYGFKNWFTSLGYEVTYYFKYVNI